MNRLSEKMHGFIQEVKNTVKNGTFKYAIMRKFITSFIRDKNLKNDRWHLFVYNSLKRKYKDILIKSDISHESTMTNYVWILWFQGEEQMPPLVKACVNSVKKNMQGMKVIVLTKSSIANYIKIPEYIEKKRENGKIGMAHYSDIIRTELLCEYGGLWLDATVLCTADLPSHIRKEPLFVYKIVDLDRHETLPIKNSSWLIYSEKKNPILMLTRKLLHVYWENNKGLMDYFLWHILFSLASDVYKEEFDNIPTYSNQSPHVLQFEMEKRFSDIRWNEITRCSHFHKLNHHIIYDTADGNFYSHIIKRC